MKSVRITKTQSILIYEAEEDGVWHQVQVYAGRRADGHKYGSRRYWAAEMLEAMGVFVRVWSDDDFLQDRFVATYKLTEVDRECLETDECRRDRLERERVEAEKERVWRDRARAKRREAADREQEKAVERFRERMVERAVEGCSAWSDRKVRQRQDTETVDRLRSLLKVSVGGWGQMTPVNEETLIGRLDGLEGDGRL